VKQFAKKSLKLATGGIDDEAKAKVFADRWREVERAAERKDYDAIPRVRADLLAADSTVPLRRGALTALVRLRAVEALGDVIVELAHRDASYRKQVFATCLELAGGEKCPFDPAAKENERTPQQAAWKAWWESAKVELVAGEEARRAVEQLASPDAKLSDAAAVKLRAIGKRAVPWLAEGLNEPKAKTKALALLKEITKQDLGPDRSAWFGWWEKNKG
jgi:hypothetical protein